MKKRFKITDFKSGEDIKHTYLKIWGSMGPAYIFSEVVERTWLFILNRSQK